MAEPAGRLRRHRAIRQLVRESALASQDELARALAARGHAVTQATLSRDLKELRIHRVPEGDGYRYAEAADAAPEGSRQIERVAALEVTGIDANEACVVVRTLTGRAQGVAVYLDGLGLDTMLATVAGDDTILVIPRRTRQAARLRAQLESHLGLAQGGRAARSTR